jgi:protein TonB
MKEIGYRHWMGASALALLMHGGLLAAMIETDEKSGATATGSGGMEMSFGPAGGAAGGIPVQPSEARETPPEETETQEDETSPEPVKPETVQEQVPVRQVQDVVSEPVMEPQPEVVEPIQVAEISTLPDAEPVMEAVTQPVKDIAKPEAIRETPPPVEVARVEPPAKEVQPEQPEVVKSEEAPVEVATRNPPTVRKKPPVPQKPVAEAAPPVETKAAPAPPTTQASVAGSAARAGEGQSTATGASASASSGGNPGVVRDYFAMVVALLEQRKRYPSRERMKRREGTVQLAFTINRDGSVSGARIAGSSGVTGLDRAAMKMLSDATPLPAVPADVPDNLLSVVVPVEFKLR